jgi:hypothetical protein
VVDYNGFTTINFICSAKKNTEVFIQAGEPILHVIPFITNREFKAQYGSAKQEDVDFAKCVKWFHSTNFYRKYYMIRKKFKIDKIK